MFFRDGRLGTEMLKLAREYGSVSWFPLSNSQIGSTSAPVIRFRSPFSSLRFFLCDLILRDRTGSLERSSGRKTSWNEHPGSSLASRKGKLSVAWNQLAPLFCARIVIHEMVIWDEFE